MERDRDAFPKQTLRRRGMKLLFQSIYTAASRSVPLVPTLLPVTRSFPQTLSVSAPPCTSSSLQRSADDNPAERFSWRWLELEAQPSHPKQVGKEREEPAQQKPLLVGFHWDGTCRQAGKAGPQPATGAAFTHRLGNTLTGAIFSTNGRFDGGKEEMREK